MRIYVTFRSGYFRALGVIRADFDARVGCGFWGVVLVNFGVDFVRKYTVTVLVVY